MRDRLLKPLEHTEPLPGGGWLGSEFKRRLHDDDWWGSSHLALGLAHLRENPDALALGRFVHGPRRTPWVSMWNVSSWIAAEYPPLNSVVKMDTRTAALNCITSGPAAYTSLIGRTTALLEPFSVVAHSGNLYDHDRLFFLELARRGPLLVNLVAQVYVREHQDRDQHLMGDEVANAHIAAATNQVLDFCEEQHRCKRTGTPVAPRSDDGIRCA